MESMVYNQEHLDELLRQGSSQLTELSIKCDNGSLKLREEHSTIIASFPLEKLALDFPETCWQANSKTILFTRVLLSNTIKHLEMSRFVPVYSLKWFIFKTPISRTLKFLYLQEIGLSRDELILLKGGLRVNVKLHTFGFQRCEIPNSRVLSRLLLGLGESRLRKFWFNSQPLNAVGLFCCTLAAERRSKANLRNVIKVHACIENTSVGLQPLNQVSTRHFLGLLERSRNIRDSWTHGFFGKGALSLSSKKFMTEHFSYVFSQHQN